MQVDKKELPFIQSINIPETDTYHMYFIIFFIFNTNLKKSLSYLSTCFFLWLNTLLLSGHHALMSLPMLTEFQASSYWNGDLFLHYYASFFSELNLFHNFPSSCTKEIKKKKKTRNKLPIIKNQNAIIESTENKAKSLIFTMTKVKWQLERKIDGISQIHQ